MFLIGLVSFVIRVEKMYEMVKDQTDIIKELNQMSRLKQKRKEEKRKKVNCLDSKCLDSKPLIHHECTY